MLFVFVTDNLAQTAASATVVVVNADSLNTFAGPVTSVVRHAMST